MGREMGEREEICEASTATSRRRGGLLSPQVVTRFRVWAIKGPLAPTRGRVTADDRMVVVVGKGPLTKRAGLRMCPMDSEMLPV